MRILFLAAIIAAGCTPAASKVTLYSAQDREFAEPMFADIEARLRLSVVAKFDTEANKSVALANEIIAERDRPRCDVHWNNEPIQTIRLARMGIFERYESSHAIQGFPEWSRPSHRTWQAFAARGRVLIVNTDLVPESKRPTSIFDMCDPAWKGRVAMAKPLFGTTATHAAALFEALGETAAKSFFNNVRANQVALLAGNKPVAVRVAAGEFAFGLTDTDDAIIELLAKKPVAIVFPDRNGHRDHPKLGVLYLPNTLALIKNGPNLEGGKLLIDELLKNEFRLARGGGYQIPLRAGSDPVHPALLRPEQVKCMDIDFERVADRWESVQEYLRNEFAR
jgi:iron(III) transport system substrate-binding protein